LGAFNTQGFDDFYARREVQSVIATATWLAGWLVGWVAVTLRY